MKNELRKGWIEGRGVIVDEMATARMYAAARALHHGRGQRISVTVAGPVMYIVGHCDDPVRPEIARERVLESVEVGAK